MSINTIEQDFIDKVSAKVRLLADGKERFRVLTPFQFEDGDQLVIVLKKVGGRGYLLCGDLVDTYQVRGKRENLANSRIYVRRYVELLDMVKRIHNESLERYNQLREAKQRAANHSDSCKGPDPSQMTQSGW